MPMATSDSCCGVSGNCCGGESTAGRSDTSKRIGPPEAAEKIVLQKFAAACNLGDKELAARIELLQPLLDSAKKTVTDGRFEWRFEPDDNLLSRLKELVSLERECCPGMDPCLSLVLSASL